MLLLNTKLSYLNFYFAYTCVAASFIYSLKTLMESFQMKIYHDNDDDGDDDDSCKK